jgi:hypothetical protein
MSDETIDALAETAQRAIGAWQEGEKATQPGVNKKKAAAVDYGVAITEGRKKCPSNKAFQEWIEKNKLNAPPYVDFRVRSDAMKIAKAVIESGFDNAFDACPATHPTGMRVWAYKTGLIKPKPKPAPRMVPLAPPLPSIAKTLQQLRREASIAAGETVSPLPLDDDTKGKIDADVKERAEALNLKDAEKRKFEKIVGDALRKVVQEGRSYKEKCDVEQRRLVSQEVERRVTVTEDRLRREKDEAEKFRKHYEELIGRHKPIFTLDAFRIILRGLHEDSTDADKRRDAFAVFNAQKFRLTGVK